MNSIKMLAVAMVITLAAVVSGVVGIQLAGATPAKGDAASERRPGCVTVQEARRTFKNKPQSVRVINRGLSAQSVVADRRPGSVWRAYRPCGSGFVDVIFTKTSNGRIPTFFWIYSLSNNRTGKVTDSWSASRF